MVDVLDVLFSFRIQDFMEIILLTAIIYWLMMLIKGTRTIPILLGLTVLLGAYVLSTFMHLEAISWMMEHLFSSIVVILVVLFQNDIRNALAQVGISTMFRDMASTARHTLIDEIVEGAYALARRKIGASMVLENESGLRNYVERGTAINAPPTSELLQAIFHTSSPLHDGAVILTRDGELAAARCILPLSANAASSSLMGTRHRSSLGLTEETDALVVVVSEERGEVSLAYKGEMHRKLEQGDLRKRMIEILIRKNKEKDKVDVPTKSDKQTQNT